MVRVELVECRRCGRPLRMIAKGATKAFVWRTPSCNLFWFAAICGEPGRPLSWPSCSRRFSRHVVHNAGDSEIGSIAEGTRRYASPKSVFHSLAPEPIL